MDIILCTREEAENSLSHHGVKGQKHGVRRWQNEDGSYTSAGYAHYAEMYGWGKKKNPAEIDKEVKRHTENAKLAVKSAGAAAIPTVFSTAAAGVTQYALNAKSAALDAAAKGATDITQKLWNMIEASRYANLAKDAGDIRAITGMIGGTAVAACVAGAVSLGAIAAYTKVRSALQKRKINKRIVDDALKNAVKHSDEDQSVTAADVLDSLSDEQKLAVIMAIDAVINPKAA